MKSKIIIAAVVILLAGMVGLVLGRNLSGTSTPTASQMPPIATKPADGNSPWQKQTDTQGSIEVEATPVDLSSQLSEWQFEIALNTHSGSLDEDLTQVSGLIDEAGVVYKPTLWQGDPPSGHHRSGTLTFKAITPMPKSVTLKLDIGGITRSFSWQIN